MVVSFQAILDFMYDIKSEEKIQEGSGVLGVWAPDLEGAVHALEHVDCADGVHSSSGGPVGQSRLTPAATGVCGVGVEVAYDVFVLETIFVERAVVKVMHEGVVQWDGEHNEVNLRLQGELDGPVRMVR